jgi:Lrp/AsnC family leucine-responsive transcriptional regulator
LYELDELDKQILTILQQDGRASHVSIAKQLHTSHTRVRDRVLRLEEVGIIEGYRAVINPTVLGQGILCVVQVEVDQSMDFNEFVEQLLHIDEVIEVMNMTGPFDAQVQIWARDVPHLRDILYDKISVLAAHKSTTSTIVLQRWEKPLGFSL